MKRIASAQVATIVLLLLAAFSGSGLQASDTGNKTPELLLEVYTLDKILEAPDLIDAGELHKFLCVYLIASHMQETGKSVSLMPVDEQMFLTESCQINSNLLIVMATSRQQEQIAAFLKKLEAAGDKIAVAKTDAEIETVVAETPEVKAEYGLPQNQATHPAQEVVTKFLEEIGNGNDKEAFALFTPKAQEEYRKNNLSLHSGLFQGMTFRVTGSAEMPGNNFDSVFVEMKLGNDLTDSVWGVRKIGDEYRIAFMMMTQDNSELLTLDFENPAKTLEVKPAHTPPEPPMFQQVTPAQPDPVATPSGDGDYRPSSGYRYYGPAQVQSGPISQAHPYTQPQPYYLQLAKPIEQTVIAVPFANRKAKDFVELLKCEEDWEQYQIFADENTNTFMMLVGADRTEVISITRIAAELFDGQKPFNDLFADLDTFMRATESVTVETFPIQYRSAKEICRFRQSLRAAVSLVVQEEVMMPVHTSVDKSGKTLIYAYPQVLASNRPSDHIKTFLAKYDVPQDAAPDTGEDVSKTAGQTNIMVFRFQNRDAAGFAGLLRNLCQAGAETQKYLASVVLFDPQSQTVVLTNLDTSFLSADEMSKMAEFYDAEPEIRYAWISLNEFLAQNPGASAKSYSLNNASAEPLCHFLRSLYNRTNNSDTGDCFAFFTDETSKKLIIATTEKDGDMLNELYQCLAKFIELCDRSEP